MNRNTITEERLVEAMINHGGSFAAHIGRAWQVADSGNKARLRTAFADLLQGYRVFLDDPLKSDREFFYEHACWSYDPKTETKEQGRWRCADALAEAEAQARARGWSYEWYVDPDIDSREFSDSRPHWSLWMCVLHDKNGEHLESLSGIDFGRDGTPWSGNPYRRVVEAELASNTLSSHQSVEA